MDLSQIDYQKYMDEFIERLTHLVQIPSVYAPSEVTERTPYGQAIADAVACIVDWGLADGFKVTTFDGHAVMIERDVELAEDAQRFDFVSHLDVVDVGSGWSYPPFEGVIDGGRFYGRGSSDMKRAVVIIYLVLRIIEDYALPMRNRFCIVLGTDEETHMDDLEHYLAQAGAPDFAVTPDATFPLGIGEKGATTWLMEGPLPAESVIIALEGGDAANVVPSHCKLTVPHVDPAIIHDYREQTGWPIEMAPMNAGTQITIKGKGAHASVPELGENAIVRALTLLVDLFEDPYAQKLLDALGPADGSGIGMACSTPEMGALTVNLGTLAVTRGQVRLQLDSRFPQSTTSDAITQALIAHLPQSLTLSRPFDTPAILFERDRPACQLLANCFGANYPEHSQEPILAGGVTYAKIVPNCVSFGMAFQGDPAVAHQADEYIDLNNIVDLIRFYTEVIVGLGNLDQL